MIRLLALLCTLLLAVPAVAEPLPLSSHHLSIQFLPESTRPIAGSDVTLALATTPEPGWHGYWSNPGDAGFPSSFTWTLPRGARTGAPDYPTPSTLIVAGLMNYVYERPYAVLVRLHVPGGLATGTPLPVKLDLAYLVCSATVCVPERTSLTTTLTVGDGAIDPEARARFDAWRGALPRPLAATASFARVGDHVTIAVPYPASAPVENALLFPAAAGLIDYAAPQTVTRIGDRLFISAKPAATLSTGPIGAVLRIGPDRALAITARPGPVPREHPAFDWPAFALALGGAVLGGLILNIMPCVFPILSLKALSLARSGGEERGARAEALAYSAGVIAVCLALGGVILGLRAGGAAAGWAFQLQDPRIVLLLLLLSVGIALNLSGLFELPTPRFVNQAASGAGGAFATGALAAFVATPCTGPFMAAALGAALLLPWPAALAVFGGLGLGLALPFLALGFVPALRRRLPRPGAWMATFRHVLSVPMWLTAVALAWVLGKQAGADGMAGGLLAALGVGLALWLAGQRQARGRGFGTWSAVLLLAVTAGGVVLASGARAPVSGAASGGAERFTEERLAALRAEGRPVFAYFTADWCLTCKVNERIAIDTQATRAAFARRHVEVLVGDWTNGDPALGRFIQAHNRAGVPLYLYYPPGAAEPRMLPQVLTEGTLAEL